MEFVIDTTIVIIRHAEKSDTGLSDLGKQRAALLPDYFQEKLKIEDPDGGIYACATKHERPVLSITPTAIRYGRQVISGIDGKKLKKEEPEDLVKVIKNNPDKNYYIVAWTHGEITTLLTALGVPGAIPQWPDECYNMVCTVTRPRDFTLPAKLVTSLQNTLALEALPDAIPMSKDWEQYEEKVLLSMPKAYLLSESQMKSTIPLEQSEEPTEKPESEHKLKKSRCFIL